jgi:broad specificity phosphatase PhoE
MPAVLLVRHAQASFGSSDYDVLSELGRRQSTAVHGAISAALEDAPLLVSGDLRRQRETATPWTASGQDLAIDARWNEYDSEYVLRRYAGVPASVEAAAGSGTLSSRGLQELLDPALDAWISEGEDASWAGFRRDALAALEEVATALSSGQTGLVFTSGGVIAACAVALLGARDDVFVALNRTAVNTGITRVIAGRRGLSLVSYNEHGHLRPGEVTFR